MKKKFSGEIDGIVETAKRQFHQLTKNKNKHWLLLIPIFIPLTFNPVLFVGITCFGIFIYLQLKDSKNFYNEED